MCAYLRVGNKKENLILNKSNGRSSAEYLSSPSSAENAAELPAVFDVRFCFNSIETIKHQNPMVVITPGELIARLCIMLFHFRVN